MNSEAMSLLSILASMVVAGGVTLVFYQKGNIVEKKQPGKVVKPSRSNRPLY
jgi:hypothetical protein